MKLRGKVIMNSIVMIICAALFIACNTERYRKEVPNVAIQVYWNNGIITMCGKLDIPDVEKSKMIKLLTEMYGKYNPNGNYLLVIDSDDLLRVRNFDDFIAACRRKLN